MSDFPRILKQLRIERGLSQTELGKILNVTQNAIFNWENGNREPSLETIEKIATIFGVTPDKLTGWTQDGPTIAEEILRVRTKKNISLEELAESSTIPIEKLKEFENGIRIPLNADFLKLAYVLDRDGKENFGQVPFILFLPDDEFPETENIVPKKHADLSLDENKLIYYYRALNNTGQNEAIKRMEELAEIVRYRK